MIKPKVDARKLGEVYQSSASGMEGIAYRCIKDALDRVNTRSYEYHELPYMIDKHENWEEALWLLTNARDEFLPIVAKENTEEYYKNIKELVLKSKGFAVLKQVVTVMPQEEAQAIINKLAQHDITL